MFDVKITILFLSTAIAASFVILSSPTITLDSQIYYSGEQARAIFANYTQDNLKSYLRTEFLDLMLILFYTLTIMTALGRICKSKLIAIYMPLVLAAFDFTETFLIILILQNYISDQPLNWLGYVTLLKWIMGTVTFLTFIVASVTTGIKSFR